METNNIIKEIRRLSIAKRFWIIEQTLKSIQKESNVLESDLDEFVEEDLSLVTVNEESLSKDWLSAEDQRWDELL